VCCRGRVPGILFRLLQQRISKLAHWCPDPGVQGCWRIPVREALTFQEDVLRFVSTHRPCLSAAQRPTNENNLFLWRRQLARTRPSAALDSLRPFGQSRPPTTGSPHSASARSQCNVAAARGSRICRHTWRRPSCSWLSTRRAAGCCPGYN
jgi:hypothetical protein